MQTTYKRVSLNIYQRARRFYVYLFRLGTRQFIGSFDTLDEAKSKRDIATKADPSRKPWSLKNQGRTIKTRRDYYYEARARGQCTSCTDKAIPGQSLCKDCKHVQAVKRQERRSTQKP